MQPLLLRAFPARNTRRAQGYISGTCQSRDMVSAFRLTSAWQARTTTCSVTEVWHIKCFESVERCSMNKIQQNSIGTLCCGTLFALLALFSLFQGTVLAAPQDQTGQTLFKGN